MHDLSRIRISSKSKNLHTSTSTKIPPLFSTESCSGKKPTAEEQFAQICRSRQGERILSCTIDNMNRSLSPLTCSQMKAKFTFKLYMISYCRPKMLQDTVPLSIRLRRKSPFQTPTKRRKWLKAPMQRRVRSQHRLAQLAAIERVVSLSKRHLYHAMIQVHPPCIFSMY